MNGEPSTRPKSPWPFRLALLLVLLFNANNVAWLAADGHVLRWDENSHYKRAAKCGHFLFQGHRIHRVGKNSVKALLDLERSAPTASYLLRAPGSG